MGTNGLASGLNPPGACWIIGNGGGGEKGTPLTDGVAITVEPRGIGYAIMVGCPLQVKGPENNSSLSFIELNITSTLMNLPSSKVSDGFGDPGTGRSNNLRDKLTKAMIKKEF